MSRHHPQSSITLSASNPVGGLASLHIGINNTLIITLQSSGSLSLPSSDSSLYMGFDQVLAESVLEGVVVTSHPAVQVSIEPTLAGVIFSVLPSAYPWTLPPTLIITLEGITPPYGTEPAITELACAWVGLTGASDSTQSVGVFVASQLPPIQVTARSPTVLVSNGEFEPINNDLTINITNTSLFKLCPAGAPIQGELLISFVTVQSPGGSGALDALCTTAQAGAVKASLSGKDRDNWHLPPTPNANLQWELKPKRAEVLGPSETVSITLSGIQTFLPLGSTVVTVQWSGLYGYSDDTPLALPVIQKLVAQPTIFELSISPTGPYYLLQPVTLAWKTYGTRTKSDCVQVALADPPGTVLYSGLAYDQFCFPVTDQNYSLTLLGQPQVTDALPLPVENATASFIFPPGPYHFGQSLDISIEVTYASSYELTRITAPPLDNGAMSLQTTLVLNAENTTGPPLTYTLGVVGLNAPAPVSFTVTLPEVLPVSLLVATDSGIWILNKDLTRNLAREIDPQAVQNITDIALINANVYWGCAGPTNQVGRFCSNPQYDFPGAPAPVSFITTAGEDSLTGVVSVDGICAVCVSAESDITVYNGPIGKNMTAASQAFNSRALSSFYASSLDGIYAAPFEVGSSILPPVLMPGIPGPVEGLAYGADFGATAYDRMYWFDPKRKAIFMTPLPAGASITPSLVTQANIASGSQLSFHPSIGLVWIEDRTPGSAVIAFNGKQNPQPMWVSQQKIYALAINVPRDNP